MIHEKAASFIIGISVLAAVLSGLLPVPALAQEHYIVTGVDFSGNTAFSDADLRSQMTTRSTRWIKRTFFPGKAYVFSEEILKTDLIRLVSFYQREGYLNAAADVLNIEAEHKKEKVRIEIGIEEGNPVLVDNISLEIVTGSSRDHELAMVIIEKLRPNLTLERGKRFRDNYCRDDTRLIISYFNDNGYAYAEAPFDLLVKNGNSVDVTWRIDPGPRCVMGDVEVTGNEKVSSNIILKQLAFEKGQVYERQLINKSQKHIYDLGMFHVVSFKSKLTQDEQPTVPLSIRIKEAERWKTKLGVGYGTEEQFRTFIDITKLGFTGGARRLSLYLKHSALEPYHVSLRFTQPGFVVPMTSLIINPYIRRQDEPGYQVDRRGAGISILHEITQRIDASLAYVYEQVEQDTTGFAESGREYNIDSDFYNKSSIIPGLKRDTSLPLFYPETGSFSSATYKISGLGFGSDYAYTRLFIDLRWYARIPVSVFAFRVKFGAIRSYDESGYIPVEDRFYAGGSSSVRGWPRQELGPKDDLGNPTGGNSLFEASSEFRFHLGKNIGLVAFLDCGNVWLETHTYKFDDLAYSIGTGLRYRTPIGPLRFDVAWPVFNDYKDEQYYFSVGHAF